MLDARSMPFPQNYSLGHSAQRCRHRYVPCLGTASLILGNLCLTPPSGFSPPTSLDGAYGILGAARPPEPRPLEPLSSSLQPALKPHVTQATLPKVGKGTTTQPFCTTLHPVGASRGFRVAPHRREWSSPLPPLGTRSATLECQPCISQVVGREQSTCVRLICTRVSIQIWGIM